MSNNETQTTLADLLGTDDANLQLERVQLLQRQAQAGAVALTMLWDDAAGKVVSLTATTPLTPLQVLDVLDSGRAVAMEQLKRERADAVSQAIPNEVDVVEVAGA